MLHLYTVPEMAERLGVSKNLLYQEIKAGRLHAKLRRGSQRPYLLTDEIIEQWWQNEMVDSFTKEAGITGHHDGRS